MTRTTFGALSDAARPPLRPVTMRAVAHDAGVSVATVSRVLNDARYVDPGTRDRVRDSITRLGYRPNRAAQSLTTGRSAVIGVIVADIQVPFFTTLARGIQNRASSAGWLTLVANSDEDADQEDELIRASVERGVDGLIISPAAGPSVALREVAPRLPVVLVDRAVEGLSVDTVLSNNRGAAHGATSHLLALGHRRIAYATETPDKTSNIERLEGYRSALGEAGVDPDDGLVWVTDYHTNGAERELRRRLATRRASALICAEGSIALGAIRAVRSLGLRVPDDLSLIGFDQMDWSSATEPPLTVVEQRANRIGSVAADLLIRRLGRGDAATSAAPTVRRIATRFLERRSCREIRSADMALG